MSESPSESRAGGGWPRLSSGLAVACLAVVIGISFAPTLSHEFVWDDHEQVVNNMRLRQGSSFADFWRQDILSLSRDDGERSNYWRPLFYVQYLAMYQLFELDTRAWHGAGLGLHLLACWAAWWLLLRLGFGRYQALAVAALFAVHPAHGESVSWIAAAYNDPPAAALLLVGLALWLGWRQAGGLWRLAAAALCYAAALCLKESALSLLLLLPLVDGLLAHRRGERWLWRAYGGLVGLMAIVFALELFAGQGLMRHLHLAFVAEFLALGGLALGWLAWVRPRVPAARWFELRRVALGYLPFLLLTLLWIYVRKLAIHTVFGVVAGGMEIVEVLPTLPWLALWYLRFLFWPWDFSPSYPVRYLVSWGDPRAWGALLVLGALVAVGGWLWRRRPVLLFGAAWIGACVWPVFNTRSFRPAYLVHQRYLYLAVLGFCVGVVWLLWRLAPRWRNLAVGALLALWTVSNLYHDPFWATDSALWQRVAVVDPGNPAAFDWLGAKALAAGRVEEAEALFRQAIAADSDSPQGHRNLALLLHTRRGQPQRALPHYQQALAAWAARGSLQAAEMGRCRLNYAIALAAVGRGAEALGISLEMAEQPPYPEAAVSNAAILLRQAGRLDAAEDLLRRAVARNPSAARLGQMLEQLRRERVGEQR